MHARQLGLSHQRATDETDGIQDMVEFQLEEFRRLLHGTKYDADRVGEVLGREFSDEARNVRAELGRLRIDNMSAPPSRSCSLSASYLKHRRAAGCERTAVGVSAVSLRPESDTLVHTSMAAQGARGGSSKLR